MMDEQLSAKIKIMSLLATVMVVYRHSLNYLAFFNSWSGEGVNGFVQDGCMVLTQIAVPYFFLVSGFFFFKKDYYDTLKYGKMLTKKGKTLFIPFLIWNIVGLLCLIVTGQYVQVSSVSDFFLNIMDSRYYGPLWYVRDLMTLMLIVPIYQWIYRWNNWVAYAIIFATLYYYWMPIDCGWISSEGILFFFLAGILQKHSGILCKRLPGNWVWLMFVVWVVLCFTTPFFQYLHKLCTLLGVITFWLIADRIPFFRSKGILELAKYSFLIYVLHFYLIKIMKVILGKSFFGNEWVSLAAYLILPIITCVIVVVIGCIMRRYMPKLYNLSTGNR